jgi:hypothetical protein
LEGLGGERNGELPYLIAVPGIVVQGVDIAVGFAFVEAGEDGLRADQAPGGAAGGGVLEGVVEPVFLARAHHGSASVVGDGVDVIGVPVQICDAAVVLAGVQHDEIHEGTNSE